MWVKPDIENWKTDAENENEEVIEIPHKFYEHSRHKNTYNIDNEDVVELKDWHITPDYEAGLRWRICWIETCTIINPLIRGWNWKGEK